MKWEGNHAERKKVRRLREETDNRQAERGWERRDPERRERDKCKRKNVGELQKRGKVVGKKEGNRKHQTQRERLRTL